jgi:subtilisin family serine protease
VLIRAPKSRASAVVDAVRAAGGRVAHQYRYLDAIAAEIPVGAISAIAAVAGPGAVSKDLVLASPRPVDTLRGRRNLTASGEENRIQFNSVAPMAAADIHLLVTVRPSAYLLNNAIANVSSLHGMGFDGSGIVVAVIDSGIRPGFPHLSLDGSVIGCEDFVGDALGCSNFANGGHGTFVAGMISANVNFTFGATSGFRNAVLAECPGCFANPPANTQIPMIGTAPLSSIYALRVFGPTGGSPTSRILMAVERVIELRQKHNVGDPAGVKIGVCNMSLGGPTLFPGRDLVDQAIDMLMANDIVPVISAGNAGPSSLTTGSPASAFTALTVAAASLAHNERILRRLQFGPINGALFRPFLGTQTAFFSSRGPHADGRLDPEVSANGVASFGQGFGLTTGSISLASGTSFSAPSVAGVAAVLRQAVPGATARQIRNAIIQSAVPGLFGDGSGVLDRGAGYVDALGAYQRLASGAVPDSSPGPGLTTKNVNVNVLLGSSLQTHRGPVLQSARNLLPGQRHDILYEVLPNTKQVIINLSNVTPALPPAQQNQLFGDDILLTVHTAKTSSIGEGDYPIFEFTTGGAFVVNDPEPGLIRITLNGDWTNAGPISADVFITFTKQALPQFTRQGRIESSQLVAIPVNVPSGVSMADFRLEWREDWGRYPTNDLDLILVSPSGVPNFAGATLNNPEQVRLPNPAAGSWTALIVGSEVNSGDDRFEFRAALDGRVVR